MPEAPWQIQRWLSDQLKRCRESAYAKASDWFVHVDFSAKFHRGVARGAN